MIGEASAVFSALTGGIELVKTFGDERVDISLRVKQVLLSSYDSADGAALAFLIITNRSSEPQSITDIILDFGSTRAYRVPLLELTAADVGKTLLDAKSYVHFAGFDQDEAVLEDFRKLPQDIYLQPNESQSGNALFMFSDGSQPEHALLILEVGGLRTLSKEIQLVDVRASTI